VKKEQNLRKFQLLLKKRGIGAAAVMDLQSVSYISGFRFAGQGDAYLLVTPNAAFCFTKDMYIINLRAAAPYLTLVSSLKQQDMLDKAKALKLKNCVFDPAFIGYIPGNLFKAGGFKEVKGELLALIREVKTEEELKDIKKACKISAKAYEIFRKELKAGMSEIKAAGLLERIMADLGGQGVAFGTIMAFGENGANPHHVNSERRLKKNEPVLLDYGCRCNGYCSDITRTFWFGGKPSGEFKKTFNIVKAAHDKAVSLAKAGMTAAGLDAAARRCMDDMKAGASKYFMHSLGHGLGLEIHESPWLRAGNGSKLLLNTIFTIEPGLYYEGKFGVRYENTVLLTKRGAEILTVGK
jgi:Xaa-Pro aminopeptidase